MATFIVTTLADDNDGETIGGPFTNGLSLREAIALANGNADADTITFDASLSGGTIVLEQALGQLVATDALTINGEIDGDHRPDMTIDAQGHSRVLTTSASTTLQGLEITGGHTSGVGERGGGVRATGSAVLTVIDSTITGNSTSGNFSEGGGLASQSALTLIGSTVTGNSTSGIGSGGGGIYARNDITISNSTLSANSTTGNFAGGGGIASGFGNVTLTNSTVSGNSTTGYYSSGGGIYAYMNLTAINSTITGNSTAGYYARGGGIFTYYAAAVLTNSLVLGNVTSYAGVGNDEIRGTVTNNHSIVGGDASLIFAQTAEVLDGNNAATGVFAGVLAENGGPVMTVALRADPTNPALDASGAGATTADARGLLVQDFSTIANINGNARDLGAFELQLAEAETRSLVVTTLDDVVDAFDGETSLREAIAFANDATAGDLADGDADNDGNANDTITFDAALSGGTILLTNGQLVATAALTINGDIDGDHAPDITIDAQGNSRVLTTSASTTLQGLEITGGHTSGYGQRGGGVHATGYTTVLTVIDSVVSGNSTSGNGARGGGIYANRNITISNSTIDANFTTGFLAGGGGVTSWLGSVTLTNTTISGNSTAGNYAIGGGIYAYNGLTAINSTITGNSTAGDGAAGGGIFNTGVFNTSGAVVLTNSLVLGNVTSYAGLGEDEIHGTVTNNHSIVGGDASLIFAQTAEVLDGNNAATGVFAGVLADNGGPVMTVALRLDVSNPALDAGDDSLAPATDARGTVRFDQPDIANLGLNISDLGAFEATEAKSLVVTTLDDVVDDTDGLTSLREAIAFANDATAGDLANGDADNDGNANDTITFDAALSGGTITLEQALGQLVATDALTINGDIDGDHAPDITIDAQGNSRVLYTSADTTLQGLEITGGRTTADNDGGGGVHASANLTVIDSVISGNNARGFGSHGGGLYSGATLTLTGSTVTGNSTADDFSKGGGAFAKTALNVTDSVISNNWTSGPGAEGGGLASTGAITLTDSTVSGNRTSYDGSEGGGIYSNTGGVTLTNTTVSGNSTSGLGAEGGGIYSKSGNITLTDSIVSGNSTTEEASAGGGIYSFNGNINLIRSSVSGNRTSRDSADGGGIATVSGSITLTDSTVTGNSTAGGGAEGGGISSGSGSVNLTRSTVSANTVNGQGAPGGGISTSSGNITLTDSTVSGNTTTGSYRDGGGIYSNTGSVTLTNSTVSGNRATGSYSEGGGIKAGTVTLNNSIVLGNFANSYAEIGGTVTNTGGLSIVGGIDPATIFAAIDGVTGGGLLADNGGLVQTIALLADPANPALDASGAGATAQDARGFLVHDFLTIANTNGSARDLGAFELQVAEAETRSLVVTILEDVVDAFDGETSLREAIAFANDATAGDLADGDADNDGNANDTITFDAALSGGTITLEQALGQLVATAALTINGDIDADHAPDITIDAQGHSRVLTTSASTTLQGLEITGGHTSGKGGGVSATGNTTVLTVIDSVVSGNSTSGNNADGGGLASANTLTLIGSTVTGNRASGISSEGGGIYSQNDITISNSAINANSTAGANGGGVNSHAGRVTLTNSTVSGNSTAGSYSYGGGIFGKSGVTAINSTITGNSTAGYFSYGGGISSPTVVLTNSLVLGNVTSYAGVGADQIHGTVTNNNSIVGGDAALIFTQTVEVLDGYNAATGVFAGVLADNGGQVMTVALLANAANPALDASGAGATTDDARGLAVKDLASVANTNGNARDLGAFELQLLNSDPAAPTTNTVTTDEDTASAAVTIGASDVDNDTLAYSVKSGAAPVKGSVAFSGDTFTFTPSPNANGADSFTILIEDGQGGSTEQTVSVTINPVNDAPIASNLSAPESYTEDTPLNLVDIVVSDVDSASVTATLTLSNTAAGALSTATSGAVTSTFSAGVWTASGAIADVNALLAGVTFTPASDFNANLTIATSVSDGIAPALTGAKALTGVAINDPPLSGNDFLEGTEDEALIIPFADLLYNDLNSDGPQPLTIVSVDNAVNGTAVISGTSVIFTPAAGFTGTASFTYVVSDGGGGYGGAVVQIEIAPAPVIEPPVEGNQPPEVLPDDVTLYTLEGKAIGLHVSASDPDDDPLSFSAGSAAHGMVTGGSGGSFVYTPDAGFLGTDGFVVTVSDGNGGTDTQAVTVEVLDLSGDPDWVLLTTSGFAGEIGGTGAVFGTAGHQDVTILDLAGLVVLDGSFNGGGDIVRLHGNASDWQVAVEGSMAVFNDGDTLVGIPAGPSGLAILFDDGARELVIDGTMQIGDQSVTEAFAVIGAAPDGTSLPAGGIDPDASAALILMPGAEVAAGGELFVFGTPGAETVTATQGAFHFDGSFNGGGDTIAVGEAPGDFTVRLDGSTAVFEGSDTSLAVPVGPAGATLSFGGTDAALFYDADLGAAFIGSQEITMTPAPLTFA